MVLVDTNVILDVATGDPRWSDWSRRQLVHWLDTGPVVINAIIYGEIGFACERIESLDALLPAHLYDYQAIPREAASRLDIDADESVREIPARCRQN